MWYLLVAAGAGYFAQRWQNTHKSRCLTAGKCQIQIPSPPPSPPSSAPATPKISPSSLSAMYEPEAAADNTNTSSHGFINKEDTTTIDRKAPVLCFLSGSAEENRPLQQVNKLTSDSPQCSSLFPLVSKANKRSADDAFLVQEPDTFDPSEGNRKDQITSIQGQNLDFTTSKGNTQAHYVFNSRPSSESATIEWITKGQSVSALKPSVGFTDIKRNAKDQVVYTSKFDLGSVDINDKEQLQGDTTSPSSCCSSSSTVLNSPVGRKPILQKHGPFQFQGKEQRLRTESDTSQNHVAGICSPSFLDDNACGQGGVSSVSNYDCAQANYTKTLPCASPWGCEERLSNCAVRNSRSNINAKTSFSSSVFDTDDKELLATSSHRPYVFTGENQRGISRRENFSNEFKFNDKVKLQMKQRESTLSKADDALFSRKVSRPVSPSRSVSTENVCKAESESLISFGLAMAVGFMVSSGKKEMENMGKVLKETEDLVSDMRKELEERRGQQCVTSLPLGVEGSNELLTMESKDEVILVGKTCVPTNSLCAVGSSDDESVRSVLTEEHAQHGLHISDLKARHEDEKPHFVETNVEVSLDSNKKNEESDSEDETDSSTREEETGEDDYVLSLLELERKLWKVFQERQEEKIVELEVALERALSKLQEKEEELQWWKNRAAWLMEHSVGSTSGGISVKARIERVDERSNCTDASSFSIKGCDACGKTGNGFSACDTNIPEFSAGETNFSDLEEECIEIVGDFDGPKNRAGHHQNQIVSVGSDGSIGSRDTEEGVLSFDVRTFRYPGYMGSIQP